MSTPERATLEDIADALSDMIIKRFDDRLTRMPITDALRVSVIGQERDELRMENIHLEHKNSRLSVDLAEHKKEVQRLNDYIVATNDALAALREGKQ